MKTKVLFVICTLLFASRGFAAQALDLSLSAEPAVNPSTSYILLAQADSPDMMTSSVSKKDKVFEESWVTWNKTHQYLGLGSLALAGLAAVLPKPDEDENEENIESSWHHRAALGAAYLGGAAVFSGVAFHYKDIRWSKFYKDPDAWHATLATLATAAFALSVAAAPDESHASAGIAGIATMAAAIKITW